MLSLATTSDLLITNQLHYRLCYTSKLFSCIIHNAITNQLLCQLRYTGTWNNETI